MAPIIITSSRAIRRPKAVAGGGGGSLTDGGNFTISGSGFGTNSATVTSIKTAIEAATAGTSVYNISGFTAWSNADGVEAAGRRSAVTTTRAIYGTKCIGCEPATSTDGRFGLGFDTGGTVTDVFIRDYVYLAHSGTGGQWKMIRFNADDGVQDSALANMYLSNQHGYSFDFITVNATSWQASPCDFNTAFNIWYEREIRIAPGTQGGSDGRVEVRFRRVSDFVEVSNQTYTNVQNYSTADRIRYVVFQNYMGNGDFDNGTHTPALFMDGTWISNGSQQRIYLGNASTWAACTQREIQDWTSWTNTLLSGTVRKGTLSSLTGVYGYVVDGSGGVNSSGYTVTPA